MRRVIGSTLALALLAGAPTMAADPDAGRTLVMQGNGRGATACLACHGMDGAGNAAAGFPRLAGLDAAYLEKQLHDFLNGTRNDPVMQPVAKAMSADDIRNASAYYAAQSAPAAQPAADAALLARGERLALDGLWDKTVPACVSCHGPGGRGVGAHFPALAGQHAGYIAKQFAAWRDGTRGNDPQDLMKVVAERLPEADIAAVAAYFASLGAGQ